MNRSVPKLRDIELMANLPLGPAEDAQPLPRGGQGLRGALDQVLLDALARPPCVVSFSGGRDSSAVLALASDAARRHGMPLPVPAIMRFGDSPESDEQKWQNLVIEHLRLSRIEVLNLTGELDALGATATDVLRRHGVRWPGNAYMHRPVIELARGGTLLTGVGGDELFTTRSERRSARQLALAMSPRRVREEVRLRRHPLDGYGWLTPAGRARLHRAFIHDEVAWPHRWDRALRHWYRSRAFAAMDGALRLVAEGRDVIVINPLLHRQVLAELCPVGGSRGFPNRTEAMRALCGDLLPDAVLNRSTKASFGVPVWGAAVREFAASWDGGGLDTRYVDAGTLRAELNKPVPDFRCILLVHQAWVQTEAASSVRS